MQTQPIHLKGDLLLIDNSTLSEICACPRRAMYKFLSKRQLKKNRAALFFGGAMHKALEVRDKMDKILVDESVRIAMYEALIEYYEDADFEGDYRNLDYACKTVDKYNEAYRFDQHPPVKIDGEPAVELPFALHVADMEVNATLLVVDPDENDGKPFEKYIGTLRIMFTGKIDRVVRYHGELYVFDHKTSSMGGPNFFSEFYTAMQFRGYKWALEQIMGESVSGVIVNGIICRPPVKSDGRVNYDMDRHVIPISDEHRDEWMNSYLLGVREWLDCIINQINFPDAPEQAFPIRTGSCFAKYGTCEFYDVCCLPTSQRASMLSTGLFEDHSWSPLDDNAKPKEKPEPMEFGGLFDHLG